MSVAELEALQITVSHLLDEVESELLPYCPKCDNGVPSHPAWATEDGDCEQCGLARKIVAQLREEEMA